jgi:hypothetical protein
MEDRNLRNSVEIRECGKEECFWPRNIKLPVCIKNLRN